MIDLTKHFNCVKAEAVDYNVLILRKLNESRLIGGVKCDYELEYRWLSRPVTNNTDEAWVCVRGADFIFINKKELDELDAFNLPLRECFHLF